MNDLVMDSATQEELRKELRAYIEDLSQKKGSDGKLLLHYPSNFSTVVDSMSREDISSLDKKPWSKYLLMDGLDEAYEKEFDGRYKNVIRDSPEIKVQKGLAQIHLLDRQLREASQREHLYSTGITTPEGSRTPVEKRNDKTFVTNPQGDVSITSRTDLASELEEEGTEVDQKAEEMSVDKKLLLEQEAKRVHDLLSTDDDDFDSYQEILREVELKNKEIDSKLASFGRLDRIHITDDEVSTIEANVQTTNYLKQQRILRNERLFVEKIDSLLESCKNEPVELRNFFVESPIKGSDEEESIQLSIARGDKLLAIPALSDVKPNRKITQRDVEEILLALKAQKNETEEYGDSGGEGEKQQDNQERNHETHIRPRSAPVQSQQEIKRLVFQFRKEIAELSELREQSRHNKQFQAFKEATGLKSFSSSAGKHSSSEDNQIFAAEMREFESQLKSANDEIEEECKVKLDMNEPVDNCTINFNPPSTDPFYLSKKGSSGHLASDLVQAVQLFTEQSKDKRRKDTPSDNATPSVNRNLSMPLPLRRDSTVEAQVSKPVNSGIKSRESGLLNGEHVFRFGQQRASGTSRQRSPRGQNSQQKDSGFGSGGKGTIRSNSANLRRKQKEAVALNILDDLGVTGRHMII